MLANRVRETTTTVGLTDFVLAGAVSGYVGFSTGPAVSFYCAVHTSANEWEVGVGAYSAGTIVRSTILSSTNGGAKVDFSAGTKTIFNCIPAELFTLTPAAGYVPKADSAGHIAQGWLKPTIGVDYLYELTDAATISVDLDLAGKFIVTLGGNRTLSFDNTDSRNIFCITIKQDGTGGRSVTWPTITWLTNHGLNTAAGAYTSFIIAKTADGYIGWRVDTRSQAFITTTNAIDADKGLNQKHTLTTATTFTLSNLRDGETLRLVVVQGAGAYAITWFTISWPSNSAPSFTTTNGRADLVEITRVGSTYVGRIAVANFVP